MSRPPNINSIPDFLAVQYKQQIIPALIGIDAMSFHRHVRISKDGKLIETINEDLISLEMI